MDYEKIRESYRPAIVKVLFVGESRPANGTFFYCCNSTLFLHTQSTFQGVYAAKTIQGTHFLEFFKNIGSYLVDLCEKPVNRITNMQRRNQERSKGVKKLIRKIKDAKPQAIICIMEGISSYVRDALSATSINAYWFETPFPRGKSIENYRATLSKFLRELIYKGILEHG